MSLDICSLLYIQSTLLCCSAVPYTVMLHCYAPQLKSDANMHLQMSRSWRCDDRLYTTTIIISFMMRPGVGQDYLAILM